MSVTVMLFASYADALGAGTLELDLPAGSTVGDLMRRVMLHPNAGALPPSPLVAVNAAYAPADRVLVRGDEVAIIPPVAGG